MVCSYRIRGFFSVISSFRPRLAPERPELSLGDDFWNLDPIDVIMLMAAFTCLLLALEWAGITYT